MSKENNISIDDLFFCIDGQVESFKKSVKFGLIMMKYQPKGDLKITRKLLEINIRCDNLISRSFKSHIIDLIIEQLETNRSK